MFAFLLIRATIKVLLTSWFDFWNSIDHTHTPIHKRIINKIYVKAIFVSRKQKV